jgi:hypothetical protein
VIGKMLIGALVGYSTKSLYNLYNLKYTATSPHPASHHHHHKKSIIEKTSLR